jgi:hypothetical protein
MAIAFQLCFKYAITKVQVKQQGWKLKGAHQFSVYAVEKNVGDKIQDKEKHEKLEL